MARVMKVDDGEDVMIGPMSIARRVKLLQARRSGTLRVERESAV